MADRFVYMDSLYYHWLDITKMVDDNYYLDEDETLIVGACSESSCEYLKEAYPGSKKYIVYQLEPLYEGHWHPASYVISNLKGADEVWDYDLDNIELLKSYGIDAKFKPFLYSEKLNRVPKDDLDIDVLFYGSLTRDRLETIHNVYTKLGNKFNMVVLWNVDGYDLDSYMARSKIILDLHVGHNVDVPKIQKQTRIYYALSNGKCVVSEESIRNYYGDLITESHRDFIPEVLLEMLDTNSWKDKSRNLTEKFKVFSKGYHKGLQATQLEIPYEETN